MRSIHLKERVSHMHMPHMHGMSVGLSHMYHDRRFWPVVAIAVLTVLFVLLVIMGIMGQGEPTEIRTDIYWPYRF